MRLGGRAGILRITSTNCVKRNHLGATLIRSLRRDRFYCCIDFSACFVSPLIRSNIRAFSLHGAKCQSLTAAFSVCYCHNISSNNTAAVQGTVSTSIDYKGVRKENKVCRQVVSLPHTEAVEVVALFVYLNAHDPCH